LGWLERRMLRSAMLRLGLALLLPWSGGLFAATPVIEIEIRDHLFFPAEIAIPALEMTTSTYVMHSANLLYRNVYWQFDDEVQRAGQKRHHPSESPLPPPQPRIPPRSSNSRSCGSFWGHRVDLWRCPRTLR